MYKECKSNQSAQRQQEIAKCFYTLLEEKIYDDITISELCQRANIPRNTFYRYFANKEAILQYLLEDALINLLETVIHMETNNHINMVEYFAYWLQHYRKYDSLWSIVHSGAKHDIMLTQMIKYYVKLSDPSFKEDFNNLQTKQIIFLSYGMQGILDVWRYTGYEQPEEEVAKQLYKLFQTPMLQIQPTGKRAKELIEKHKEHNYFIEEYMAVH